MGCVSVKVVVLKLALLVGTLMLVVEVVSAQFISWNDMRVDNGILVRLDSNKRRGNLTGVIVVDQSGNGDSTTIQGAIDLVPHGNPKRIKILVLPGIYREKVKVEKSKPYISLIGKENQRSSTIITWNNKASDKYPNGTELGTYNSAAVSVFADYFCATEITFQNTIVAMPGDVGRQAVALRVAGEKAVFYRVSVLGWQDSLLDECGSHLYIECFIQGSVDFIFGNGRSLYKNSVLHSVANQSGAIAAHGRNSTEERSGFSFYNCTVSGTGRVFLGRAWGVYSTVVYSYCNFQDDIINPERWSDWNVPSRRLTCVFGEFQCRGKGADAYSRNSTWTNSTSFAYQQARPYLDVNFIEGDKWLRL